MTRLPAPSENATLSGKVVSHSMCTCVYLYTRFILYHMFYIYCARSDGGSSESPLLVEEGETVGAPHSPRNKHSHSHSHSNPHRSHSYHHEKPKQLVKYGELVILG